MNNKFIQLLAFVLVLTQVNIGRAQEQAKLDEDPYSMSLEELMNIPVTIATQKATALNETPGSISVITEDMIRNSGARDLNDLMVMVPGFDIASDYNSITSFGVRGNWALEGKILVLIDGQIINETNYGSAPLSQRFPLTQIEKIEIIRGSGSVIYGGVAALAVISITTKSGDDLNGVGASQTVGVSEDKISRSNSEFSLGTSLKNGIQFSVHGAYNSGNNSNRIYHSPSGDTLDYRHDSAIRSRYANAKFSYKGLNLVYIAEDYSVESTLGPPEEKCTYFNGQYVGASYTLNLKKLTVLPTFSWKQQQPWNIVGGYWETWAANTYRTQGSVKLLYPVTKAFDVMAGTEYYNLLSRYRSDDPGVVYYNDKKYMTLNNIAFFAEGVFQSNIINVTAGLRYDNHSTAGDAFVPRLALTKAFDKVHFKATYSQAFKTPLVYNINTNKDIEPEKVQMIEFEAGYKVFNNTMLSVNLYDIKIDKSIVYLLDEATSTDNYVNAGRSGTRGIETELRTTGNFGFVTLNHSLYKPAYTEVTQFLADNDTKSFMGLPTNKVTLAAGFPVTKKISINPSVIFLSKRSGYVTDAVTGEDFVHTEKNFTGVNCNVSWRDFLVKDLTFSLAVHDALNQKLTYVSAYYTGLNPQPAQSREFLATLKYEFNKK